MLTSTKILNSLTCLFFTSLSNQQEEKLALLKREPQSFAQALQKLAVAEDEYLQKELEATGTSSLVRQTFDGITCQAFAKDFSEKLRIKSSTQTVSFAAAEDRLPSNLQILPKEESSNIATLKIPTIAAFSLEKNYLINIQSALEAEFLGQIQAPILNIEFNKATLSFALTIPEYAGLNFAIQITQHSNGQIQLNIWPNDKRLTLIRNQTVEIEKILRNFSNRK